MVKEGEGVEGGGGEDCQEATNTQTCESDWKVVIPSDIMIFVDLLYVILMLFLRLTGTFDEFRVARKVFGFSVGMRTGAGIGLWG